LSPITFVMGLPAKVGTVLIFGVLRKELTLIMLLQAIGTVHPLEVLTAGQIIAFAVFVVFYFPCLATLSALIKELGLRWAIFAVVYTTAVALVLAALVRWGLFLVGIT
ncbi:MAG TPA: ferrous iron transport protein B, partial [Bacteroidetes bacterium]|nr:ferrous iron transport protein B [Bacteroidota bacterium]